MRPVGLWIPWVFVLSASCVTDSHAPSHRDKSAPSQRDNSAPSQRDSSTPSHRDNSAPSQRDNSTPSHRDNSAPSQKDNSTPPHRDNTAPSHRDNSVPSQSCDYVFKVKQGSTIILHIDNFTQNNQQSHYCTMQATAGKHMRVVVDLLYSPPHVSEDGPRVDCTSDYVHVGNDAERLDVDLMTSYKFCGDDVRHEVISKGNHMWLVYKASTTPTHFVAKVRAQTPADQFLCSPVQCVHWSRMCDGVRDCTNGHDEFCHREGMEIHSSVLTEPCFRCGDGTCIQPSLSWYDDSYGRYLWYLCDGFSHCPDSWDERQDCCRDLQAGRAGSVVQCVPSDLQFGVNGAVVMWDEVMCNAVPDCYHGEDEDTCNRQDSSNSMLHADPATIGAVVGILVTGCAVVCVAYRLKMSRDAKARLSTSSTVDTKCTLLTSSDCDRSDVTSGGAACSEAVSINMDTNLQSSNDDNVNDDDASSLNSLNLRQTIV